MVGSDIFDRGLVNRCQCSSYFVEAVKQDASHFVKCSTCKTQGPTAATKEQAFIAWNNEQRTS